MGKGDYYEWERRFFKDEETGVALRQLTSFPTINFSLGYHQPCFTPDSTSLIFYSYVELKRGGRIELFKVNVDGTGLCQLTDGCGVRGGAVISPDGKEAFYISHGEVKSVNLESLEERTVFSPTEIFGLKDYIMGGLTVDSEGKWLATALRIRNESLVLRIRTSGSEFYETFKTSHSISHLQFEPAKSKEILFLEKEDIKVVNVETGSCKALGIRRTTGHFVWLGKTRKIASTLIFPERAIIIVGVDSLESKVISSKEVYFWHIDSSSDGKWIVSDTNWPDMGLFIVDPETGAYKKLCNSRSSNAHPQYTHPHPSFSPDTKMVLFNSDRSGHPQIYLAVIPKDFLRDLGKG